MTQKQSTNKMNLKEVPFKDDPQPLLLPVLLLSEVFILHILQTNFFSLHFWIQKNSLILKRV